jgi:hypothetical protein
VSTKKENLRQAKGRASSDDHKGGVAPVEISKSDGRILRMIHGKWLARLC